MPKTMRILHVTESMGWSGGAHQTLMMASALRKRGQELWLICQPGSEILSRATEIGIPTVEIRMRQDYDVPAAYRISRAAKGLRANVLHAQHSTAHALALISTLWYRPPVFAVTRRVTFPIRKNLFSRLKYLSQRINGYVAISQAVREELENAGIVSDRIEVIPSATDIKPASKAEGQAIREEFRIPAGVPLVVTIGNYADFKGQDHLIKAASLVVKKKPQVRFLLAGRDIEKLTALVLELGLRESVTLAGFRRDVPQLLAASDVFAIPSLQEAAATALREAMLVGLPVVATNVGGIPESVTDADNGLLVPPANPEALATAILRLIDHPLEAAHMALRGKIKAETHWTIDPAAERMERFYERLLARAPEPESL